MKTRFDFKKIFYSVIIVLMIILVFTIIDYAVHSFSEEYAVPPYYFRNKIIFGTLIGLVAYFFVRKLKLIKKSVIFSAVISILLQTRYFLEGYSIKFVAEFLVFHFVMILVPALVIFKFFEKNNLRR